MDTVVTFVAQNHYDFNLLEGNLRVGEEVVLPNIKRGFYVEHLRSYKDEDGWVFSEEIKSLREGGTGLYFKSVYYPSHKRRRNVYWEQPSSDLYKYREMYKAILNGEAPSHWDIGRLNDEEFMRDTDDSLVPILEVLEGNPAYTHLQIKLMDVLESL